MSKELQPRYVEAWNIPGFSVELCGINPKDPSHVNSVLRIEKALSRQEYSAVDEAPTITGMQSWMSFACGNLASPFKTDSLGRQTPNTILQGVLADRNTEAAVAIESDKTPGEITDYVYLYRRTKSEKEALKNAGLPNQLDASGQPKQMIELSYTHTVESNVRMSEGVAQVAAKLMQHVANNNHPDARLNADEISTVEDKLLLYAQAGTGDDEIEYRKALRDAGAVLVGAVSDDSTITETLSKENETYKGIDEMNYVYYFSPENVQAVIRNKQQTQ